MKIEFKWEPIASHTYRAKVIGGWIVQSDDGNYAAMVFVKDPLHVWEIERLSN